MPHFSLSGRMRVSTPAWRIHKSARDGSGADISFFSSAQTRSADSRSSPSFSRAQAFSPRASGRPAPYQAKKRKKRRMRRKSSRMRVLGVADEADACGCRDRQARRPGRRPAVRRRIERVDGEVAALGVAPPVAAEAHLGAAAVGLDVVAQCRHLDTAVPAATTVIVPCSMPVGTVLKPAASARRDRFLGQRRRRDVDIGDGLAEQRVAHRAAGDPRLLATFATARRAGAARLVRQPVGLAGDRRVSLTRRAFRRACG